MVNLVVNVILIPQLIFFPLYFIVISNFVFDFSHVYFPLIRAPMLHRLKILCIRIHSAAWILSCICIILRTLSFCLFSVFFTVIHTPFDLAAHCFRVVPLFSTGMGNVEVLSL